MCEYCEKGENFSIEFENAIAERKDEFVLLERIVDNKIFITANLGFINKKGKYQYCSTLSKVKINYCPICGRKLGEE